MCYVYFHKTNAMGWWSEAANDGLLASALAVQVQCMIRMNEQLLEEMYEFKYLGSIQYKYRGIEGETTERTGE